MRKKIIFLFVCTCCMSLLNAQVKVWTLEECIQHAIDNNITIKQVELQKISAEIDIHTAQMSRLPDLNGGMDQRWSFGRARVTSGLYDNQTLSNTNFYISSSVPVFTGFRINNEIARNKLELKVAVENLAKAKEDLSLNITSLFLQVLFNNEILRVNEEQLILSRSQVERTQALVEVGKVPMSQLYDIEAQVAQDELSVVQATNNLELALLDLKQSMELENEVLFEISAPVYENIVGEYMESIQPPQIIFNNALNIKPVVKEQEYKVESAEKSIKIAESLYYPKVNMNMGYGTNYYYNYDLRGKLNPNTQLPYNASFKNQWRDNGGEYIGLSLSIPIFNRFYNRNQVHTAKINRSNQQLALENVKKTLYKEIQTAYQNATSAQEKLKASAKAVKATTESYNYAQERYEIGKSGVFEFNEAKTKLVQSQSEEIQAKYEYIFRTKILDFYNGIPIRL